MSADPAPGPDIAIRARPPSPRRLSRRVLLTGAILLGGVIAFALAYGLSERPERASPAQTQTAAQGSPPHSIAGAPAQYEALDLAPAGADAGDALVLPVEGDTERSAWAPQRDAAEEAVREPPAPPLLFARGDTGRAPQRGRLEARLIPPRTAYDLMAGAVIPAALQTELNSERPGRAIAQVTAPVFDSVSGAHLLIPQGSRLIGAYESGAGYGDRRLLVVWERLILPDGWSIDLAAMEGADGAGAAGLSDRVDNHLDRLAIAVLLSAVMGVAAEQSETDDDAGFSRSVGDAAAATAAASGGRIVERELAVRPTLVVRAGAPVRVLVTRDISLRPWRGRQR